MIDIFRKTYDGESLYDLQRDTSEAFYEDFNAPIKEVPKDEYGIHKGRFVVTITWDAGEE
jgi:hypothetical protein